MSSTDVTKNPAYKALFEKVSEKKIWNDVKEAGGNPNEVFAQYAPFAFDVYANDQNDVRSKFIIRRLEDALQVLNNKDNTGLIIGTYDSVPNDGNFNNKKPESAVLLKGNGKLLKMSIFDHNLYTKPGVYNLNLTYNEDRDSYIANSVLEYKPITKNPIPALLKNAKTVGYDWEELDPSTYPIVMLKGKVSYVQAYPRFDGGAKVGDEPVYMPNHRMNPVMIPVFQVILDKEGTDKRVTVSFAPTNNGIPYIGDEQFKLVKAFDAMGMQESKRVEEVSRIFKGNEYVIVGTLTKIGSFDDKEGNNILDVRIRGICMLNTKGNAFEDCSEIKTEEQSNVEKLAEKVGIKKTVVKKAAEPVEEVEEVEEELDDETEVEEVEEVIEKPKKTSKKVVKAKEPEEEDDGFF